MGELDNDNTNYPHHTRQGGDLVKCFWCEDNGIDIRPEYHYKNGKHEWRIGITINNKYSRDPKVYDKKDVMEQVYQYSKYYFCLLYTSPSPRDRTRSRMPSSA